MAASRLTAQGRQTGVQGRKEAMGKITGQIRRIISVMVAKANAEALLSRTDQIGGGTRAANERQQWALYEDVRMRNERIASWIIKKRGMNVLCKGFFKLNINADGSFYYSNEAHFVLTKALIVLYCLNLSFSKLLFI